MKKITIIFCIILTLTTLSCAAQLQPPKGRSPEVPKSEGEIQQSPKERSPEVPKSEGEIQQSPNERTHIRGGRSHHRGGNSHHHQGLEPRPPTVQMKGTPVLVPSCNDNEIFKDGKCVAK